MTILQFVRFLHSLSFFLEDPPVAHNVYSQFVSEECTAHPHSIKLNTNHCSWALARSFEHGHYVFGLFLSIMLWLFNANYAVSTTIFNSLDGWPDMSQLGLKGPGLVIRLSQDIFLESRAQFLLAHIPIMLMPTLKLHSIIVLLRSPKSKDLEILFNPEIRFLMNFKLLLSSRHLFPIHNESITSLD
jgi:hypothetical protein